MPAVPGAGRQLAHHCKEFRTESIRSRRKKTSILRERVFDRAELDELARARLVPVLTCEMQRSVLVAVDDADVHAVADEARDHGCRPGPRRREKQHARADCRELYHRPRDGHWPTPPAFEHDCVVPCKVIHQNLPRLTHLENVIAVAQVRNSALQ